MLKAVLTRTERIDALEDRDGKNCFLCGDPFKTRTDITFDHWIPQSKGGTWELSNLRLAHKRCNALKGDVMPNPDGTLPERPRSNSIARSDKRGSRPDLCQRCSNGRSLGPFESCDVCHSGPMPDRYPRWAKVKSDECDHAEWWCYACASGLEDRKPAVNYLIEGP